MLVRGAHLTYCSNVHPGESWSALLAQLQGPIADVRSRFSDAEAFGLGLRVAADACETLKHPAALQQLQDQLQRMSSYVFTLNGFPYGAFHGKPVKAEVYLPDWRQPERLQYTLDLAELLARLLPPGMYGSISTVPGGYKRHLTPEALPEIARNLLLTVAHLEHLARARGVHIALALEPEPCCLLETTPETVEFFERHLLCRDALCALQKDLGLSTPQAAEDVVRRRLGVCLDTCHAAVEFETAGDVLDRLEAAGISIAKVQLSAGLRLDPTQPSQRAALAAFDEDVYLHQVVTRATDGALGRFDDLPDAFASAAAAECPEWRVHFHVPIYARELQHFSSTQSFVTELMARHLVRPVSEHLEVETYTWHVLPPQEQAGTVVDSVVRELEWVREQLGT